MPLLPLLELSAAFWLAKVQCPTRPGRKAGFRLQSGDVDQQIPAVRGLGVEDSDLAAVVDGRRLRLPRRRRPWARAGKAVRVDRGAAREGRRPAGGDVHRAERRGAVDVQAAAGDGQRVEAEGVVVGDRRGAALDEHRVEVDGAVDRRGPCRAGDVERGRGALEDGVGRAALDFEGVGAGRRARVQAGERAGQGAAVEQQRGAGGQRGADVAEVGACAAGGRAAGDVDHRNVEHGVGAEGGRARRVEPGRAEGAEHREAGRGLDPGVAGHGEVAGAGDDDRGGVVHDERAGRAGRRRAWRPCRPCSRRPHSSCWGARYSSSPNCSSRPWS